MAQAAPAAACAALAAALDLAPELTCARVWLAALTADLAQPKTAAAHVRTLTALPGMGLTMTPADAHDVASVQPDWIALAQHRLHAGDLASAQRHAAVARAGRDTAPAPALTLLAEVADLRADHRLAAELRLSRALADDLTPALTLALSATFARGGDHERAARWLSFAWPALEAHPAARALLGELVAALGTERAGQLVPTATSLATLPATPSR
jgi:hypothetical protein